MRDRRKEGMIQRIKERAQREEKKQCKETALVLVDLSAASDMIGNFQLKNQLSSWFVFLAVFVSVFYLV